jgi:hypothetical protein
MNSSSRFRGFTLLECALAAAILAAFLPVLYAITARSFQSWDRLREESRSRESIQIFFERLERDLDSGLPLKFSPFEGRSDFMSFPVYGGASHGLSRVTYREIQPRGIWVRESEALIPEPGSGPDGRMILGVKDVDFSFTFDPRSGWIERWGSGTGFPKAVRVRIVSKGNPVPFEKIIRLMGSSSS